MPNSFKDVLTHFDPSWVEHGYGTRFQGFQNLMRIRIRDILLVSSLYDLFVFEEDGRLYELVRNEYQSLKLTHSPELTRVSSGREALTLAKEEKHFDLIITTLHIEDMTASTFAQLLRQSGVNTPIVLLTYDNLELSNPCLQEDFKHFHRVYMWQSDFRLLIAIIKQLEDRLNVDHDTRIAGVQSIIVIEDNVRFYSHLLPVLYREIILQAQRLISEGINLSHKEIRTRARPKILHCTNFEEAWEFFQTYQENVLGVISDVDFARQGRMDPEAGFQFYEKVKSVHADIPFLFQSNQPENDAKAKALDSSFLLKNSPDFAQQLHRYMMELFSFGDFVFRLPDGGEVGRAQDLISLEKQLAIVPTESIRFHAEKNHFSHWLKARTEFWLAHKLRPRAVSDFPDVDSIREDLIYFLREYRKVWQRGIVTEFRKETFNPDKSIARIGKGSIGGKARGLSFVNILLNNYLVQDRFEGVSIQIPPGVIISTDVFDTFLDRNHLRQFALQEMDDHEIIKRFLSSSFFPEAVLAQLAAFLDLVREPLSVRSSSLLEDSQYHPLAGVYQTYMIPNNHPDPLVRLSELIRAIKRVYASTFYRGPKDYFKATSYRLEEEKMAVLVQRLAGNSYQDRFYPEFSGVARSYNFYPVPPQKATDGIVSLALGLGKTVVDGGLAKRFCPQYPLQAHPYSRLKDMLNAGQRTFYALNLRSSLGDSLERKDPSIMICDLATAEQDGTLTHIGSTYSADDDRIYDGISRSGPRLITFHSLLKNHLFPLAKIIDLLLGMGTWGMGTPVEIEFAVNLKKRPIEFGLLQMRPLVLNRENEELTIGENKGEDILCRSRQVLGHGRIPNIRDILIVDREIFERSKSMEVAAEISQINSRLISEERPYVLITVGRLGSLDPWLGIPVTWDQISGVRVIIESNFKDFNVTPSQGSHFFQNLISFTVGFFTISLEDKESFLDWDWLLRYPCIESKKYIRLLRFQRPLTIIMNSRENRGVVLKPQPEHT